MIVQTTRKEAAAIIKATALAARRQLEIVPLALMKLIRACGEI